MTKLNQIIGIIKDKASQSKAAILSNRATLSLLRATSHDPSTPPNHHNLSTLLSSADGPRSSASAAISILLHRLHSTHSSAVALKCLLAAHHVIRYGTFILQDQLSTAYPCSRGGRNYLNLSYFRDKSTPTSWELSSWVRWYAHHIENILFASRTLGSFFLAPTMGSPVREKKEEMVSSLTNGDLLRELDSLVALLEGIATKPNHYNNNNINGDYYNKNKLVEEVVGLVEEDAVMAVSEVSVRVNEFKERMGLLSFGEGVELVCILKRLEECKDEIVACSLSVVMEKGGARRFWESVKELKEVAGKNVLCTEEEEGKRVGRSQRRTESERFLHGRVVLNSVDLVRFPSSRFF
ncbi:hypothetical protein PIB30_031968 [Stylosanthes scabra]|uniref:ENTH domain-containing protein n=1 Tax=Stylosanthes scabra TaxID=79078 RepID=A0ABU6TBP6_9FABA|nr:hypothetical protein [Stylosanthes scabra]